MVAGDGLVDGVGLCDGGEGENEGEVAKEREGNLSRFGGEHGGGVLGEYEVSVGAGQRAVQAGGRAVDAHSARTGQAGRAEAT